MAVSEGVSRKGRRVHQRNVYHCPRSLWLWGGFVFCAADTEDGGGDSSDESFDCDYSDDGPVSELDEEGLEEALVRTAVPTARRPYTNVICVTTTRDSVTLGRYTHAARMRVRACWQSRSRSAARNWPSCVLCGLGGRPV